MIEAAANSLIEGVSAAAGMLADVAASHPAVTGQIAEALHQEDGEQTRCMACTILANAFVFQETLAGGPETACKHVGVRPTAALPNAKAVVIILTATGLPDETHNVLGPVWLERVRLFT